MKNHSIIPIPSPPQIPWLGNIHQLSAEAPVQSLQMLAKEYGEVFRLKIASRRLVVISSQRLVDEVCDESRFQKKLHGPLTELRALAGDGLFTAETHEPNWEIAHRLLMPAFGPLAIRGMFDDMMDIARQLFLKWERLGDGTVVDIADNMTRLTLDTIALASFHYRFNSFYQNEIHFFVKAMVNGLEEANARSQRPGIANQVLVKRKNRYEQNIRMMQNIADELIAERRAKPSTATRGDLLDTMLNAVDPVTGGTLDATNIRNQLVTFLIAGHETTSGLLSFAVYELLKNPAILAKARAEVDAVVGDREPRVEDMAKLGYIEQILKETLRLWPTAPAFAVHSIEEETTLGGAFKVHKDETILVLTPELHRDSKVWVDPDHFVPSRMAPENFAEVAPNAWKPFGNGARACIGRGFAMQEAILVLTMAIQKFDLEFADPHYQLEIKESLTLKPAGLKVMLKRRGAGGGQAQHSTPAPVAPARNARSISMGKMPANKALALQILYGSNSGSSETLARKLASEAASRGCGAEVGSLDEAVGKLSTQGPILIVTASYDGKPPENAKKFCEWLPNLSADALKDSSFAVFGCGNSDWARTYQAIPQFVDRSLEDAGATRLLARAEGDARGDFYGSFETWTEQLWSILSVADEEPQPLAIEFMDDVRSELIREHGFKTGRVIEVRDLVARNKPGARPKIHVALELPVGMEYQTGDYLHVLGSNPASAVARALKRFNLRGESKIVVKGEASLHNIPRGREVAAREILAHFVELAQPATRNQIANLAASTRCPPEQKALLALIETDEMFQSQIVQKRVSLLDLLETYQSCMTTFIDFIKDLPPMRPRQYSISSSPLRSPRECTLTVAVVNGPAWSGSGEFGGVGSNYLAGLQTGDEVAVLVRKSKPSFGLPHDPQAPVIMIAAGTGLAPFRGFIEERRVRRLQGEKLAPARLFFGCDHPELDFIYREELEAEVNAGALSLRTAFSADVRDGVGFVQHRLWKDRKEVLGWIAEGAQVYVCGDGRYMAPAVRRALIESYADLENRSLSEAEAWLIGLEQNERFVEDVFA